MVEIRNRFWFSSFALFEELYSDVPDGHTRAKYCHIFWNRFQHNKNLLNTKRNNNKISFKYNDALGSVKNLKKKKLEPNMILDLHGHTLYSSKLLLHKIIPNCYEKNIRNILIITGKGQHNKGTLKKEVPKWLNDKFFNKFLVNFNQAPKHFGGEGALLVRIKNRYKKLNN